MNGLDEDPAPLALDPLPPRRWGWIALAAVVISLAFAAIVIITAVSGNSNKATMASSQAASAHDLAVAAAKLTAQIQTERRRNIITNCEAQNARHDNTIKTLDDLIATAPPSQRARAKASRESTVALLNAIVPFQNCKALAERSIDSMP